MAKLYFNVGKFSNVTINIQDMDDECLFELSDAYNALTPRRGGVLDNRRF